MDMVIIDAEISEDGQLIYKLPPNLHAGRVKLVIQPLEDKPVARKSLPYEEARRRLQVAGKLSTGRYAPEGAVRSSEQESERLAQLFGGGSITTLDLINEDRGSKG